MLAIFIPTVYLWVGVDTVFSAILAVSALALCRVVGVGDLFKVFWGNASTAAVLTFFMLATLLQETGALPWICKWFVSRKIVHGHPFIFLVMFGLSLILVGTCCLTPCLLPIALIILKEIMNSIGYGPEDDFYQRSVLMCMWAGQGTDCVWPMSKGIVLTIITIMASIGYEQIELRHFLMFGLPMAVVIVLLAAFFIVFILRPDTKKFHTFDDAAMRQQLKDNPISTRGKIALAAMVVTLIMWLIPVFNFIPFIPKAFFDYFSALGFPTPGFLAIGLLAIITVDGEPVLDLKKAFEGVPWSTMMLLNAVMVFATYIGSADYGISTWMGNLLAPMVQNLSPWVAVAIGLIIPLVLTQFLSNTVSATVCAAIFIPLLASMPTVSTGMLFAYGVALWGFADLAYLTPSSSPSMSYAWNPDYGLPMKAKHIIPCIIYLALLFVIAFAVIMPVLIKLFDAML